MKKNKRLVIDTNVVVSALLFPDSSVGLAFSRGLLFGTILVSEETLQELQEVLMRDKLDKYLLKSLRQAFMQKFEILAERIDITEDIIACRDPKDDKFLSLAVSAKAAFILTGDNDLLDLNPFRNIPILSPSEFLKIDSFKS
jgi:putative PIN family toxin of toxin-antitoxin system